jgi:hypothetical protein
MAVGGIVDVDVDEARSSIGMAEHQAGLLLGLAQGRGPRLLPRFEVPAGLQPTVQALVHVKDGPAASHHDSRAGHVLGPGPLVEWARQRLEVHHDAGLGLGLAPVTGHMSIECGPDLRSEPYGPAAAFDRSPDGLRHAA